MTWVTKNLSMDTWYDTALAPCWWIAELYEKFKTFVDESLRRESQKRKQKFQYKLDIDFLHFGGSLAHALLRKPQPPRPQCLEIDRTFHATLVRQHGKAKPKVYFPDDSALQLSRDLTCNGDTVRLTPTSEPHIYECTGFTNPMGTNLAFKQAQLTVDPEEASDAFFAYWDQYWVRDDPHVCPLTEWSDFKDFLDNMPTYANPSLDRKIDADEWYQALRKTKAGTARGVCGFSKPELSNMHLTLLNLLLQVLLIPRLWDYQTG